MCFSDRAYLWKILPRVWLTAERWPVRLSYDLLIKVNVKFAITSQFIWRSSKEYYTNMWQLDKNVDVVKMSRSRGICLRDICVLWEKKSHGISKIRSHWSGHALKRCCQLAGCSDSRIIHFFWHDMLHFHKDFFLGWTQSTVKTNSFNRSFLNKDWYDIWKRSLGWNFFHDTSEQWIFWKQSI